MFPTKICFEKCNKKIGRNACFLIYGKKLTVFKWHRLKMFFESFHLSSRFPSSSNGLLHVFNYIFFSTDSFFYVSNLKEIIFTPKLSNNKNKSTYFFESKRS